MRRPEQTTAIDRARHNEDLNSCLESWYEKRGSIDTSKVR